MTQLRGGPYFSSTASPHCGAVPHPTTCAIAVTPSSSGAGHRRSPETPAAWLRLNRRNSGTAHKGVKLAHARAVARRAARNPRLDVARRHAVMRFPHDCLDPIGPVTDDHDVIAA